MSARRPGCEPAVGAGLLRVAVLGLAWAALVVGLLLFAAGGRSFIYQGF